MDVNLNGKKIPLAQVLKSLDNFNPVEILKQVKDIMKTEKGHHELLSQIIEQLKEYEKLENREEREKCRKEMLSLCEKIIEAEQADKERKKDIIKTVIYVSGGLALLTVAAAVALRNPAQAGKMATEGAKRLALR